MRAYFYFIAAITISSPLFLSCKGTTIEQDMMKYCDCVVEYDNPYATPCIEIIDEITEKYEYDPEALEYIKENVGNCK